MLLLQVKRATKFLNILFEHAPEPVVVVITHSGFARSLLLAVQREPYRPQNAELIPVLVEKTRKRGVSGAGDDAGDDDSWVEAVLDQHAELLAVDDKGAADNKQQQQKVHGKQQSPCVIRRFLQWAMQRLQQARQ
jgi:hypothetical protein